MGRAFTIQERHGIWRAHTEVCWLCKEPVPFSEMEVDHVIPATLANFPDRLAEVITRLGLPPGFDVESFLNWRPSHRRCNGSKSDKHYDQPFIAIEILNGAKKSARAEQLAKQAVSDSKLDSAFATVLAAAIGGRLQEKQSAELQGALNTYLKWVPSQKLPLTPEVDISGGKLVMVKQPYGWGYGPEHPDVSWQMRCGVCGNPYFNGSRCTLCGNMDNE